MNKLLLRTPKKCWAYLALSIWAALSFILLHKTNYGIDEGAARALLLVWSVTDNVVSPIVTLGVPDFRTLFLAPVGILWTGSIIAAKVATLLVMAVAAWTIHAWRLRSGDEEGALLATGLLLIAPLTITQMDSISVAAYLLVVFGLGVWADQLYRDAPKAFGGMYFGQLFLCLVSTSLHPVGLAYPLALLWAWYKNPLDKKQQKYFYNGIAASVLMALILTTGWAHVEWFANPVKGLSNLLSAPAEGGEFDALHWITGIVMLCVLLLVIWKQAGNLWADLLGRTLLLATALGALLGDEIFAVLALTVCLYWGLPLLLSGNSQGGFLKQRGLVMALTFILATTFMIFDKSRYLALAGNSLSPRDSLIKMLAEDSGVFLNDAPDDTAKKSIRVASQWPGLTMLACRCDALPLPPDAKDSEALLTMLRGVTYMIFDPRDPMNRSLAHNLATMPAGKVETVVLQQGGVIIFIHGAPVAQPPEPKA